jgi:hypothetical protein
LNEIEAKPRVTILHLVTNSEQFSPNCWDGNNRYRWRWWSIACPIQQQEEIAQSPWLYRFPHHPHQEKKNRSLWIGSNLMNWAENAQIIAWPIIVSYKNRCIALHWVAQRISKS